MNKYITHRTMHYVARYPNVFANIHVRRSVIISNPYIRRVILEVSIIIYILSTHTHDQT